MPPKKICLFTAHSPRAGGGGTILRSLINELPDILISWYYIGDHEVAGYENGYLGKTLMGGVVLNDIWQTWKMLADQQIELIERLVDRLLAVDCDGYWIVTHNEGLRVALELTRRQTKQVHVTVHDDWAGALCARSIRYRFMSSWANKMTIETLKVANSFDVVSSGMQQYYQLLSNRSGEICHRYLPESTVSHNDTFKNTEKDDLIAGHIGSIYSKTHFIAFLSLFCEFAATRSKKAIIKMWGCHLSIADIPVKLQTNVQFYETLPEDEVVTKLKDCTFVYAMYPLNKSLNVFTKTSLPTKLTSYLQAGKPIFGHGPADSTLATFLAANNLGVIWTSLNNNDGFINLEKILALNLSYNQLENTRQQYFGEKNLAVMVAALS